MRKLNAEMGCLPSEIKFNILSRLPVRMLCRCKSVSKDWLQIISDPYFLKLHQEQSKRNKQLLLLNQGLGDDEDDTRPQFVHFLATSLEKEVHFGLGGFICGYVYMIPSGHDLICLINRGHFHIFSPSFIKGIRLPQAKLSNCLEMDAGFGYIPSQNEYKLVHMFDVNPNPFAYSIKCEILTLTDGGTIGADAWKEIKQECPFKVSGWGVLANNKFYWIVSVVCTPCEEQSIVSLDLETETFDFIPHPHYVSYLEGNDMFLVELKGQLCFIDTFAYPPVTDIWVLVDPVRKIWVKEHRIDLTMLQGFDDEQTQVLIHGYENGELVISSQQKSLEFYDTRRKIFRKGEDLNLLWHTGICLYTESFFSLGIVDSGL
ncbi:hypothetical protein WN943_019995 [Citrus x changshan-huyou]|nr:putative F-box protein At2g02030 [Citrus x clementina]